MEPVTPGEILLEEFILPAGLSQTALAKAIGVPPRRINEIVLGKRAITADTDLRLARYWGVSEGFFLNLQKSYDLRMQRAKTLLRTTRLGIEEIAQAVGYSSSVTFDRIFKRASGLTPSEFRASGRHLGARDRRDRGSPEG